MSHTVSRPHLRSPARAPRLLLAAAALAAIFVALVAPAQRAYAANYQFWGYYQLTAGKWVFATTGQDQTTPAEGAVEGWRWGIDDGTGQNPRAPRATPTFTEVCDTTPAEPGRKRVAVVIDYGRAADGDGTTTPPAPVARCASVASAATGAEVLAAVATVRTDKGLVCGIDNYPAAGCGGQVATLTDAQKAADTPVTIAPATASAPPSQTAAPAPTGAATAAAPAPAASSPARTPIALWIGLVVLVAGVVALVWSALYRRRSGV